MGLEMPVLINGRLFFNVKEVKPCLTASTIKSNRMPGKPLVPKNGFWFGFQSP